MLELRDVSYEVEDGDKEKGILKHINLKIEDRFVAITGQTAAVNLHWPR